MHESMRRLYKAAKDLRGTEGQSAVADLLGTSPQVLNNWESRGVSKAGAILAQEKIGCSPAWLTKGEGWMTATQPISYPVPTSSYRKVWVVGKGKGGLPERVWTDGDYPVGATDEYAEVATSDPHAFLVPVVGDSMVPRFQPGEFALVEPATEPELEDDVLVRLATGETMLKRLLSRRDGYRFGSWNDQAVLNYRPEEVVWVYYVAHPVPSRKIKHRV
jgi:phage repressor protein C with HTH and peptisase S24 domain